MECVDNEFHVRIEKIETSIHDTEMASEFTETQRDSFLRCFISKGKINVTNDRPIKTTHWKAPPNRIE